MRGLFQGRYRNEAIRVVIPVIHGQARIHHQAEVVIRVGVIHGINDHPLLVVHVYYIIR